MTTPRVSMLPPCAACGRRVTTDEYHRWQRIVAVDVTDVYCGACIDVVLEPCRGCGALLYRYMRLCERCSMHQENDAYAPYQGNSW